MTEAVSNLVIVGKVTSPYGVKGWVKVYSYTDPFTNLLHYSPWLLKQHGRWAPLQVLSTRVHGNQLVAQFQGIHDRNATAVLRGVEIAVTRDQLPGTGEDEFYWFDLEGLDVVTRKGELLGVVDHVMATGANDVLIVKGQKEYLIPYVLGEFVENVSLHAGKITVNWDPDF
ncbi:MAG: ribosome maturation factor RimM [Gammaproteobacteria bacterium]|nr:ribosome maturation factor RimM [Gammaproteobacteria bacterium]